MIYQRTIRLSDTDAAGVLYFAVGLSLCHEAYEASLASAGIDLRAFFRDPDRAIPLVRGEIDFLQPVYCGDAIAIALHPRQLSESRFEIDYRASPAESSQTVLMRAKTIHVSIDPKIRKKIPLSDPILGWIASFTREIDETVS